jgi:hypothetical protein
MVDIVAFNPALLSECFSLLAADSSGIGQIAGEDAHRR